MRTHSAINDSVPTLYASDSVQKGIELMEALKVLHLPVVKDMEYLGIVTEDLLLDHFNPHEQVENLPLGFQNCFVFNYQHIFDVVRVVTEHQLSSISVLDTDKKYIGTIVSSDLLMVLGAQTAYQSSGSIIELLVPNKDYSLSEISRIIESNGGKITYTSIDFIEDDQSNLKLTMKLMNKDINPILAALERFEYNISDKYMESLPLDENIHRLDHFFKYLNM